MARSKRRATSARTKNRRSRRGDEPSGLGGWWAGLGSWQRHALCVATLLVVSLGFFAPIHFSGQSLIGGDTVQWRSMAEAMIAYEAETGEPALWNPNAFAGMPGYMTYYVEQVPQLDDVPSLLRKGVWPTSHLFFLLLGTYLLVFVLTRNRLAGVLAASAYGLTTYMPVILVAGHNTKFIALCYAPWLVLAFVYALRRPRLLSGLLFAAALAVNLRAGHVQITYYFTVLIGIWWVAELGGAYRDGSLPAFGKATGWLALGSLLGVMMVAQPYLVNAEYKAHTIRGSGSGDVEQDGLDLDYAMRWSQGPGELLTLVAADAYGGSEAYWGPKPFTGGPHYLGGLVLLFAVLGLWGTPRRRAAWGLGVGALLMTLFALGRHFPALNEGMYAYFPLFDAFRAPETWMSAVAFALAVLAGLGVAFVVRPEETEEQGAATTRAVLIASGVAVGLAALLWLAGDVMLDFEKPGEQARVEQQMLQQVMQRPDLSADDPQVRQAVQQQARQFVASLQEERVALFGVDALRTLLFLLPATGALWLYRRRTMPAWALQGILVVLVVVDLGGVGRRYLNEDVLRPSGRITAQIPQYGFDRYILEQQRAAGGPGHFRVASFEQGDPTGVARPAYYYETIGGYHGAKLRLYQDYIDHIFRGPDGRPSENALDLLNVEYVVAQQPLPGTEVAYRDEQTGYLVLRNPDALPRAFFVEQTEVVERAEATWERLRSPGFDPRTTALLPEPLPEPLEEAGPIDSSRAARATLDRYGPREIAWTLETDARRLLVISEVYYPDGWTARLDGEEVPIHRVDYLLRGVVVPEGQHELVMRFDPASHGLGVWVSWIATLLVYGGVFALGGLAWQRRRSSSAPEHLEGAKADDTNAEE